MSDITKIKVNGDLESSYKIFSKNREFEKRAESQPDMVINYDYVDNSCMIVYGTYENVLNKIINDANPTVYLIARTPVYQAVFSTNARYFYKENLIQIGGEIGLIFNVYPDNTIGLADWGDINGIHHSDH